ncbi:bifunctional UDP-N-acetylglucosamine diphosphorylase/glucosamine-1-phosphate N-acetyltransferase GlmU [Acidocella sp.]|uniref:bifunctional UDP-N-acetylglucosamine diphosphorylase/glucosamine-1-phosphate N-acetyltransferase GlmU n=1 Tax=Acidocella sp. TaxID=50710 RepID=UPI0017CE8919|nr:bifunctional UDP-N-acetylglucosamine diphosphorylase/glucosamine-1-phosphate N-acetyltransferase GlmU [Acidocella sp.]NNM57692.1 bifunctional UDP-N-acetylglucosamine diphosphorylase/glucosamine-1-phosphate N-acetyltransferase GlmU [Acidocella sp.]
MENTAVIIAAGLGTRMKSTLPKAAHKLAGREMLRHLTIAAESVFTRVVVVVGPDMPALEALAAPHGVVVQAERLGTAHAARQAEAQFGEGLVAVFYADNPLVSPATMQALLARARADDAGLVLLAMTPPDPGKYGRLVMRDGYVSRIVEYADATPEERRLTLCNAGGLAGKAADMRRWLAAVKAENAKGEYYLTDIAAIAQAEGVKVAAFEAPYAECMGINSRAELAAAEAALQTRLREAALESGVSMLAPETVFFSADTLLGADVIVGPYVVFGPGVTVEPGAEIKAFSHLEGCVVHCGALIGPYARLRPGADIGPGAHVGNFVEIKAATLGAGAKANHLAYIGDAEIGPGTNIGAGTITCNYDGTAKHKTRIGAKVFIGSNTALVAPITVGDGALVAAGSTLTEDVAPNTLALGRARQVNKPKRP